MTTTPTQENWLANAPGRSLNYDGHYGLQCVDAVDAYAQDIFGVPWQECVGGVVGANQLLDAAPDAYWTRIDNDPNNPNLIPARGDVVVYGGDGYNQFGHTAIVIDADPSGVLLLQQDGFAAPLQYVDNNFYSNKPAHTAWLGYDQPGTGAMLGWLRPRPSKIVGYTPTIHTESAVVKPAPAPAKEDDMPTYKRIPPIVRKKGATLLGIGRTWYLKDKGGKRNLNLSPVAGMYDVDLFLSGTGLTAGESLTVQFVIVTSAGKRSGYFSQDVPGTKAGAFRGHARFSMPVPKGAFLEVAVTSSATGPDLTTYGADVKVWQ